MEIQLAGQSSYAGLVDLEWDRPLEEWTDRRLVRMAHGRSRHVVRFIELDGRVFAVKEIDDHLAVWEYRLLRAMAAEDLPVVQVTASVTGRTEPSGGALPGAVVTRYLDFALPYTYILGREGGTEIQRRLLDSAAALLVQLHLEGFWWGDCSLANVLFRRDAGGLRAYLVDSETAEQHDALSDGQRRADLEIAMENVVGGIEDLIAAGRVPADIDSVAFAERLVSRYQVLWAELTAEEEYASDELWRLEERIERLNRLGFDAAEMSVRSKPGQGPVRIRPSVVEEGHHGRLLSRLTGIDVQENQARRLLNDLGSFRADIQRRSGSPISEGVAAHRWLTECFEPFVSSIPKELRGRLEPAEAYHQYLEHRWFLSESAGRRVPAADARRSFFEKVLRPRPEEKVVLPDTTAEVALPWLDDEEGNRAGNP
ncbi:MAG TPA: DUF4032 domain-containing protein [Acidimicrobiales bacterium]|nr:DUF4032 domain-containing protein [Acidimicrobiales bacterium]